MRFKNKVAIVTGASKGIGLAIAVRLAAEGATVVAASRGVSIPGPRMAIDHIEEVQCDVSKPEDVARLVQHCETRYGRLDVLCNNAGIAATRELRIHEGDLKEWDRVLGVNLRGALVVLKHCIPLMMQSGGGSIVNIGSIAGMVGFSRSSPYTVSKAGLLMLSRVTALEYAEDNIRSNAVCPGITRTQMAEAASGDIVDSLLQRVPMGRMAHPEEVATLVAFLASDESAYITGACYTIDGGRTAN